MNALGRKASNEGRVLSAMGKGIVRSMNRGPSSLASRLEEMLAPEIRKLGYELLDLEYLPRTRDGGPVMRLFIDSPEGKGISFDDCAAVDHGLDPLFESADFETLLAETFTLEVSSPGLDRPLRKPSDFQKYAGKKVQVKTYRPLSSEEMGNPKYFEHHQKQKNFFGVLHGYVGDSVELETDNERFKIPFALITKANLDVASQLDGEGKE
jgi:ribosome maturation factor RimP